VYASTQSEMGTDIRRLECVRCSSLPKVKKALCALLAEVGFVLAKPSELEHDRTISLVQHGEWIAIEDSHPLSDENWALRISRALGIVGVSMRALPDFGSLQIRRLDAGKAAGLVVIEEDTKRSSHGWLEIKVPFLAEFASKAAKKRLVQGIRAGVGTDEMLILVAQAAELPESYNRYTLPPSDARVVLAFSAKDAKDSPRTERAIRRVRLTQLDDPNPLPEMPTHEQEVERRREEFPPLHWPSSDLRSLDEYLGRQYCIGEIKWDGPLEDVEADIFDAMQKLADRVSEAPIQVERFEITMRAAPTEGERWGKRIKIGAPFGRSSSARGNVFWARVREHLLSGAGGSISFGSSSLEFVHRPHRPGSAAVESFIRLGMDPCPVRIWWCIPVSGGGTIANALAASIDEVVRRCARTKHVVEVLATAAATMITEPPYLGMAGLRSCSRKRAWYTNHVPGPGWRVYVPPAALKKLKGPLPPEVMREALGKGALLISAARHPLSMSREAMNAMAAYLLPAVGTYRELAKLERQDSTEAGRAKRRQHAVFAP